MCVQINILECPKNIRQNPFTIYETNMLYLLFQKYKIWNKFEQLNEMNLDRKKIFIKSF